MAEQAPDPMQPTPSLSDVTVPLSQPPESPSQAKQSRKRRSWVWEHFKELALSNPTAKRRATCAYCNSSFACDPKLNGTGTLASHIKEHCTGQENPFRRRVEDDGLPNGQQRLGFKQLKPGETYRELVSVPFSVDSARL